MFDLPTPKAAEIIVVCFTNEFPDLPAFYGCTLLTVDEDKKLLTEWQWTSSDSPQSIAAGNNYQLQHQMPLSGQSVISAISEADMLVVMGDATQLYRGNLLDWLQPLKEESRISLTILSVWSDSDRYSKNQDIHGFDTVLLSKTSEETTDFVRPIIEMVTNNYLVGVDFSDVKTIFSDSSPLIASGSSGISRGEGRAETATRTALSTLSRATSDDLVFVAVIAGGDLQLEEYSCISKMIDDHFAQNDRWQLVGCVLDPLYEQKKELKVVIISCSPKEPIKRLKTGINSNGVEKVNFASENVLDIPEFLRK